jgi:hypothetical protein
MNAAAAAAAAALPLFVIEFDPSCGTYVVFVVAAAVVVVAFLVNACKSSVNKRRHGTASMLTNFVEDPKEIQKVPKIEVRLGNAICNTYRKRSSRKTLHRKDGWTNWRDKEDFPVPYSIRLARCPVLGGRKDVQENEFFVSFDRAYIVHTTSDRQ